MDNESGDNQPGAGGSTGPPANNEKTPASIDFDALVNNKGAPAVSSSTSRNDPRNQAVQNTGAAGPPATAHDWMPQVADDTDLIEKEWVDKAKEVVARTSADPFTQNKELNRIKSEYLKKRYNKVISKSE